MTGSPIRVLAAIDISRGCCMWQEDETGRGGGGQRGVGRKEGRLVRAAVARAAVPVRVDPVSRLRSWGGGIREGEVPVRRREVRLVGKKPESCL